MTAWEDPENKDPTSDILQDELEVTTDERISEVQLNLIDLKRQLGL